jgi:hypothetical protein
MAHNKLLKARAAKYAKRSAMSVFTDGRSGDDFYLRRAWLAGFEAAYRQYGNPPKRVIPWSEK